jgi:tRNA-uridine 2-sulfurtransferase
MSGGMDSAMALVLLQEQGYDVLGVTMRLWRDQRAAGEPDTGDIDSARAICDRYGVEHRVLDLRESFYERVVAPFASAYARASTPNPCILCNQGIKFGLLLEHVLAEGQDLMATGHYVRTDYVDGRYRLLRGVDAGKDQSYFLYTLTQERLARVLFPLGSYRKEQVRALAAARGLTVAERPESQDVCFLQGADYGSLIARLLPGALRPGPIVTRAGEVLGEHRGLPYYTVGQRSGLGIAAPRPLYVLALDGARNALVVGYAEELGRSALLAECVSFVSGEPPVPALPVEAQIRYRAEPVPVTLRIHAPDRMSVTFERPMRDISPGQSVVLYRGEEILGGGVISATDSDVLAEES